VKAKQVQVRVEPSGHEFDAFIGEDIMSAAVRAGYRWPTICQGSGVCMACYVQIDPETAELSEMSTNERKTLDPVYKRKGDAAKPGEYRLACRAKPLGDITVIKRGVLRL
jgi:ferredoxin